MQPLMMTEEDDLFFKLLPFHQRDFAKKVFDELQTALLKNELTTSREDITLKVIRQSMDQIKLEQDSILSTQRKTTAGKKGVISTENHSQLEEEILNEVLSQVKKKNRLHRGVRPSFYCLFRTSCRTRRRQSIDLNLLRSLNQNNQENPSLSKSLKSIWRREKGPCRKNSTRNSKPIPCPNLLAVGGVNLLIPH